MSKILLVTGGSRSGKSAFAQKMAEALPGPRVFLATCPVIDPEMGARILRHQQARCSHDWQTLEEPLDLAAALQRAKNQPVVLVDCLTLWVNNVMYEAGQRGQTVSESEMASRCQPVLEAARNHGGTVIFVTNEVGMSLVPETPLGRRFRDLAGRVSQIIAAESDEVFLVVCGQPLKIKPQNQ